MLDEELERKRAEAKASQEETSMKMDAYVTRSFYASSHPKQVGFGDGLK